MKKEEEDNEKKAVKQGRKYTVFISLRNHFSQ